MTFITFRRRAPALNQDEQNLLAEAIADLTEVIDTLPSGALRQALIQERRHCQQQLRSV